MIFIFRDVFIVFIACHFQLSVHCSQAQKSLFFQLSCPPPFLPILYDQEIVSDSVTGNESFELFLSNFSSR